jgi:hypothetical protein
MRPHPSTSPPTHGRASYHHCTSRRDCRPVSYAPLAASAPLFSLRDPPKGRCHWTLQLLADELVVLGLVNKVSTKTVRQAVKKNAFSVVVPSVPS